MYQWAKRRLRGHMFVCFLALVFETVLARRWRCKMRFVDLLSNLQLAGRSQPILCGTRERFLH